MFRQVDATLTFWIEQVKQLAFRYASDRPDSRAPDDSQIFSRIRSSLRDVLRCIAQNLVRTCWCRCPRMPLRDDLPAL